MFFYYKIEIRAILSLNTLILKKMYRGSEALRQ